MESIFGPSISVYSRRDAIEDGQLVQLSGPGYQGDANIPAACREAGFVFPVAMTAAAFTRCVAPIEGEGETLAPCQDSQGRLWDVLWMLRSAIRRNASGQVVKFSVMVVPNVPDNSAGRKRHPRPVCVDLRSVCGPDDDGEPCITIMMPDED